MPEGISVIVPVYNTGRYLDELVDSIMAQNTRRPFEIIFCDDCSTDAATHEKLRALKEKHHPLVKVTSTEKNGGPSAARNRAITLARYDYILSYDSDDIVAVLKQSFLDIAANIMDRRDDVVMVCARKFKFENVQHPYYAATHYEEKAHLVGAISFTGHMFYRRANAMAAGGYNEDLDLSEDWDFVNAMLEYRRRQGKGRNIHIINEPYFGIRRRHDFSSITESREPAGHKQVKARRASIANHPGIFYENFGLRGEALLQHLESELERRMNDKPALLGKLFLDAVLHPTTAFHPAGPVSYMWYRVKRVCVPKMFDDGEMCIHRHRDFDPHP